MAVKDIKHKLGLGNKAEQRDKKVASFSLQRFLIVYLIIGIALLFLFNKLVDVQLRDSERLIREANKRSIKETSIPFTRGKILDRNQRLLSITVPLHAVNFDPKIYFETKLQRDEELLIALARETNTSAKKIRRSIKKFLNENEGIDQIDVRQISDPNSSEYWKILAKSSGIELKTLLDMVRDNPSSAFVMLQRQKQELEQRKWKALAGAINENYKTLMERIYKSAKLRFLNLAHHQTDSTAEYIQALDIDLINVAREFRRFYPLSEKASQLIGFTDLKSDKGEEGLERSYNALLIGKNGKESVRRDKRGNVIELLSKQKQYDPQDIVLSIDEDLQTTVYNEILRAVQENKAESGTAVLVDVQTGEILAMANAPSFNPHSRRDFKPEFARNRAITDTFEPGSTVKPFTVLTALQTGVTYRDEIINVRPFSVNGFPITDVAPRDSLSLTGILQKSSNRGVSRLALRMPSTALPETYSKVGFGKDTGLGLGEQRGTNGDRKRWSDIDRAALSYGYGLNVTPVQLARAYATLGSFGIYRPLSITKVDPPVIGERVLPEKITREVVHMMESVAQKGEGGQKAAVEGYRVAVKTGTARKLEKGHYVDKYLAYTAGVAPASDPRFALVVLINDPKAGAYYGGAISAPLFSKIMGYTLKSRNIKPDRLDSEENQ